VCKKLGGNNKIFVGVESFPGADQKLVVVMITAKMLKREDGIIMCRAEPTVRDIGDLEVVNRLAAFEAKAAERGDLRGRTARLGSRHRRTGESVTGKEQQRQEDSSHPGNASNADLFHDPPSLVGQASSLPRKRCTILNSRTSSSGLVR